MTAQHYPIEIQPPDIAPYRDGNTGVDYVHVLDSGRPGPTAMVQALTHGNEICGAIALDFLLRDSFSPEKGKLVLAFANVEAFKRFDYDFVCAILLSIIALIFVAELVSGRIRAALR